MRITLTGKRAERGDDYAMNPIPPLVIQYKT